MLIAAQSAVERHGELPHCTVATKREPPAADDLPLTGKVAATEVADGKREKVERLHYINSVQTY